MLKQKGRSTLGGRKVWFDPDILRINYDGQGMYLGEFQDEDRVLVITTTGDYYLTTFEETAHFDRNIWRIERFRPEKTWSLALWNADLGFYYGKRFQLDAQLKPQNMLGENTDNRLIVLSDRDEAIFRINYADGIHASTEILMSDFIEAKSPKARGKRFTTLEVASIEDITPAPPEPEEPEDEEAPDTPDETPETTELTQTTQPTKTTQNTETTEPTEPTSPALDVPFTITNEVPESSQPVDNQLSLF